jgi:hypothetical protein
MRERVSRDVIYGSNADDFTLDRTMTTAFATIAKDEWALSTSTPKPCRALLHRPLSFGSVMRQLCAKIKVVQVRRNRAKSADGYFRASVKVRVLRRPCTLFHSGRSGYRAQHYRSITNGERANAFAVSALVKAIRAQLRDTRLMTKEWIERSLLGRDSKVWIHQGQWLRQSRRRDQLLMVERWMRELASRDKERRKLARWASLVPQLESAIDIKGAFLTMDGEPLPFNPKQGRSKQIHDLGFT